MQLLVLSAPEVHELLGYPACVSAVRAGLTALAAGQAQQPLRTIVAPGAAPGRMGLMPAYQAGATPAPGAYGLKAIVITPGNPRAAGLDAHQGVVLLSDGQTGEPRALLNASAVTEIRTAAVSVLATDLLARPDAGDLAVIGTGVQARAHLRAFRACRPLRRIRVAGRDLARAAALAAEFDAEFDAGLAAGLDGDGGVPVTPCATAAEAVDGADIIVTATNSAEPVLRRAWVADGAHVNAVGACLPAARELDGELMGAAGVFCDSRDSLASESGDFRLAVSEGHLGAGDVRGTLGELLTGAGAGRSAVSEITVFESLGLAVEDLAAAQQAFESASAARAGQWVRF